VANPVCVYAASPAKFAASGHTRGFFFCLIFIVIFYYYYVFFRMCGGFYLPAGAGGIDERSLFAVFAVRASEWGHFLFLFLISNL